VHVFVRPLTAVVATVCLGVLSPSHLSARTPQAPKPSDGQGASTAAGPQSGAAGPATQKPQGGEQANELDAFMEKVLARREVNRKTLEQYILDEVERFDLLGPGRMPLYRSKRDYTWYARDGMHVRSPLRYNGVTIGEEARQQYETNWIRREKERQERKAKGQKESGEVVIGPDGVQVSGGAVVPTEPRFVSEAYFMDFKFEPGNYYLAGREALEGQEVLKIEYYPTQMFGDDDKDKSAGNKEARDKDASEDKAGAAADKPKQHRAQQRAERGEKKAEEEIERRMNKTALVTLWVDPKEHQIVKYTFDNVWLDFLPAAWLVRVDDLRASMTMGQPFPGVWLPRGMNIHAGVTLASGSYEAGYERVFSQYRLAEVSTKIKIPKRSGLDPAPAHRLSPRTVTIPAAALTATAPDFRRASWRPTSPPLDRIAGESDLRLAMAPQQAPALTDGQRALEVIGEIRIHGNAFLGDQEVLQLAGIAVGQPLASDGVEDITKRLNDSGRFESVEVRKRYRSLTTTSDIALVLVVHEKAGVRSLEPSIPGVPGPVARPVGRLRSKLMFLPIVSYADGYGFTYGGRMSTIDLLGIDERLSLPLTWGGTRRAAVEFERQFKRGPLTRIDSSFGIWNRENPRFEIRDQRVEVKGRAERVFKDVVRLGADASRATISYGDLDDRLWTFGTTVSLDTRLDPSFPGNAVLIGANWTGLHFREIPDQVNRYTADARGYLRVFRQIVIAGRAQHVAADATLPPYERLLLGGSGSLRGFGTGTFDGDRTFIAVAEVRVPITSVLRGAKLGVTAFMDAGKVWNFGSSMDDAAWHRGAGGGVFLIASIVRINLDVAHGLRTGDTHVHLSSGFTF
jgi:Omp85 superfamily domain/Surface antigen variable number repeat